MLHIVFVDLNVILQLHHQSGGRVHGDNDCDLGREILCALRIQL